MRGRDNFTSEFFTGADASRTVVQSGRPMEYVSERPTPTPTTRPPEVDYVDHRVDPLLDEVSNGIEEDANIEIDTVLDQPTDTGDGFTTGGGYGGGLDEEIEEIDERGDLAIADAEKKARLKKIFMWLLIAVVIVVGYRYIKKKK